MEKKGANSKFLWFLEIGTPVGKENNPMTASTGSVDKAIRKIETEGTFKSLTK